MSILLEARERGAWAIPGLNKIVLLNWDDQSKFDKFNSLTVTHVKITDNHIVSEPEIEYYSTIFATLSIDLLACVPYLSMHVLQ